MEKNRNRNSKKLSAIIIILLVIGMFAAYGLPYYYLRATGKSLVVKNNGFICFARYRAIKIGAMTPDGKFKESQVLTTFFKPLSKLECRIRNFPFN